MARKCTQKYRSGPKAGKCKKFSGKSRLSGLSGTTKGACKKWSKGRTKCLKRAKR